MNTNDDKIQWHPAFDAALQIELEDEAEYLEFEPEHLLSKKPMQIDVLVKNEKDVKIKKNIGRIFRQYNIIEYKSPDDKLNIDDANDIEKLLNILKVICLYNNDKHVVLSLFNKVTMDTYKFYLDGFEFMFYSYFNMRKSKN